MNSEVTLVLAGNARMFEDYCRYRKINPREAHYYYVSDPERDVLGQRGARLIKTNRHGDHAAYPKVLALERMGFFSEVIVDYY